MARNMSLLGRQAVGWVPIATWDLHEPSVDRRRGALSCVCGRYLARYLARYLEVPARMRQMEVRGMSTEYPHGGGRYLGQWGSVSLIYISRVSSVSSPLSGGTPHTSKSTKKCLYRPGGPSGWGLDGQVSCQGHPLGVGTSPPHVSWAYPSIFSRKGPVGTPGQTPQNRLKTPYNGPYSQR